MLECHPRIAIGAFLGISPDAQLKKGDEYVSKLKQRLDFVYKVASRESARQGRRHKRHYNLKVGQQFLHLETVSW